MIGIEGGGGGEGKFKLIYCSFKLCLITQAVIKSAPYQHTEFVNGSSLSLVISIACLFIAFLQNILVFLFFHLFPCFQFLFPTSWWTQLTCVTARYAIKSLWYWKTMCCKHTVANWNQDISCDVHISQLLAWEKYSASVFLNCIPKKYFIHSFCICIS